MLLKLFMIFLIGIVQCCSTWSTAAAAAPPKPSPATQAIKDFDGQVGIYAKNLKTGKTYSHNADVVFPTASTSKLVVAMAVYKYLYPKADAATKARYAEDIRLMMQVSDNEAFHELLTDIAGSQSNALDRVVNDMHLKQTRIHNEGAYEKYGYHSVTTAYEMGQVFEKLFRTKYLDKTASGIMKNELADTIFQDEIPRYLSGKVMHKIGELDDILCDVGVADDGNNQILLSIYTRTDQGGEYASDFIAQLSSLLFQELSVLAAKNR